MESDDDEDFDIFLKNVKAKNDSLSKHSPEMASKLHSVTSDDDDNEPFSEDEIDFGYWESASGNSTMMDDPKRSSSADTTTGGVLRSQGNLKEVDLNLL